MSKNKYIDIHWDNELDVVECTFNSRFNNLDKIAKLDILNDAINILEESYDRILNPKEEKTNVVPFPTND